MSWLSSGPASSGPSTPKRVPDGAFEAPNRTDRALCWAARDAFFACLDKNGIIDSLKDSEATTKACESLDTRLQKDCASSWVSVLNMKALKS